MKAVGFITVIWLLTATGTAQKNAADTAWIAALRLSYDSGIRKLREEISMLRSGLLKEKEAAYSRFTAAAAFLDVAVSSANNLQSLVMKESYRNKIASLNNPASNELGFNLQIEINNALRPLFEKTRRTNAARFTSVVGSFVETGKRSSTSLFPAGNIFTSIVGLVGNLAVHEKGVEQEDLDHFIAAIEKYFVQYERLYQCNYAFNIEMDKLKARLKLLQEDIRMAAQDLVLPLEKNMKRSQLKKFTAEELLLKYFSPGVSRPAEAVFPADAISGCKAIANNIQRIYDDYSALYDNNYKVIRSIITDTRSACSGIDQVKLNKTMKELEALYNESRTMDADNLRLKTLQERVEQLH
ncbi:MAG TPA: hypothetical protein VF145_12015 [Chitinophagaceae bacterium]